MCNRYIPPDNKTIHACWHVETQNSHLSWQKELFPRGQGPFIRSNKENKRELVVGQWGLIPHFAKTSKLKYNTNNARYEELKDKASYRDPWKYGQRCVIPVKTFDEPCWETGRNIWWRFQGRDGNSFGLAGLWNTWIDQATGELFESYTMLTINADKHPLMSRMHKPDPNSPPDAQDKRSVVPIDLLDIDLWLSGSTEESSNLIKLPTDNYFSAKPLSV